MRNIEDQQTLGLQSWEMWCGIGANQIEAGVKAIVIFQSRLQITSVLPAMCHV